jgi:hypothetical protein
MALLRRKLTEAMSGQVTSAPTVAAPNAPAPTTGPFDSADAPELGARADLGALRIPVKSGQQLRMELDSASGQISGVTIMVDGEGGPSTLQLQAFAAPRNSGIWDEIRAEIAAGISGTGGRVDDVPGTFGRELIAWIPKANPGGGSTMRRARFVGVDGPRWFLRGVMTGPAAGDDAAASAMMEDIFKQTVVVRDNTPKPPRDLLPLTLPGGPGVPPAGAPTGMPAFNPMKRGPEITEIR